MHFRPYPILSIFSILILVILISLGNWQFERFQFKQKLENAPPAAEYKVEEIAANPREFLIISDVGEISTNWIAIDTAMSGKYGKRYFSVLKTRIGDLIFEHGFVSNEEFETLNSRGLKTKPISGKIKFTSVLRKAQRPNKYVPQNDIKNNKLYWPEPQILAQLLNSKIANQEYYLTPKSADPFGNNAPRDNPFADPKGASYVEPARHLGYAITWWGLAIGLIGVYIALHFKNGRFGPKPE